MLDSRFLITLRATLGGVAALTLASCELPPSQAWREIQREGLIPYVFNNQDHRDPSTPGNANPAAPQQIMASTTPATPTGSNVITSSVPSTPSPAMLDKNLPQAAAVPGLVGYVRTPFTNPPRLVDVRGMTAGSKVVCPYTHKPFLVPAAATESNRQVATAPVTAPTAPAPTVNSTPEKPAAAVVPAPATKPAPVPSKVAALDTTKVGTLPAPPTQAKPAPQTKPLNSAQAPTKPNPQPAPSVASVTPPKAESQDIPYGVVIPGRPGFVNSPYAAKHQLVDVTGLPAGMEVKCPYTGKLFRVPPQDQAKRN